MRHLESVRVTGDRRSHWRAKAPAGQSVEWNAVTVEDVPNELISWRSEGDADVLAKLFREEPGQQVKDDLLHLKQVMEVSEVVLSDATLSKGPHPARPDR